MIRAIAIDDESPALQLIEHYCNQSNEVELLKTFTSSDEALKYLKKFPVDLVFLDIQMPGKSGLELRTLFAPEIAVVLTTAYSEYAPQGFDLDVVDYLVKIYSFERFTKALEKVKIRLTNQLLQEEQDLASITLRADYSLVKVPLANISYLESLEDYTKIFFTDDTAPMIFRITMKYLEEKLPNLNFLRVHRSYIVHADKVEAMRRNSLFLPKNIEIPIGRKYKNEIAAFFKSKLAL